jgi:hypothetical protein
MSVSFSCRCEERQKPAAERAWRVITRRCPYSAFAGNRRTYSDYSLVACLRCGALGRTKAAYVDQLPSGTLEEFAQRAQTKERTQLHASIRR